MSGKTIRLDIVSAEEQLFSADVQMVFAPAMMGEVGVSPQHTPLMTKLKAGDVRAQISDTETKTFFKEIRESDQDKGLFANYPKYIQFLLEILNIMTKEDRVLYSGFIFVLLGLFIYFIF